MDDHDDRLGKTGTRADHAAVMVFAVLLFGDGVRAGAQLPASEPPPISAAAAFGRGAASAAAPPPARSAPSPAVTPGGWPRLHLPDPIGRQAARKALDMAWERLAQTDCAGVPAAFTDRAGHPLDERLRVIAVDLPTYLTMLVFIDGSRDAPCVTGVFAFTAPGSRVVRLCVDELKRAWLQDPEHTVASFIHEMLHTLGLGENPPSSAEITRRVLAGCRRRR